MKRLLATILFLLAGGISISRGQYNLSIFMVDSNIGYVGGGTGINSQSPGITVRKTDNGGATWDSETTGAQNSVNSLFFLNADTGWAVGWNPILKTVDGGGTWIPQTPGAGDFYYAVHFVNADTGWVVGNNTLLHTTNGGGAWASQPPVNCCATGYTLYSVAFTGADTGYAVGNTYVAIDLGNFQPPAGLILKTTDGGASWNSQLNGVANTLYSVCFGNHDTGWAVGDSGIILRTTDGGADWNRQTSGTGNSLRSIACKDTRNGWIVGDTGIILKTADGGADWMPQPAITSDNLRSISLIDSASGWIAGDSNTLLKIDGGTVPILKSHPGMQAPFDLENGVLRFSLRQTSRVKATLMGWDGTVKSLLLNRVQSPGDHTLDLTGLKIPAGLYILDFENGLAAPTAATVFLP